MDAIVTLLLFSVAMFLGCYLAGSIPLVLSLSEKLLRKVTIFGAGLLVGTALIIIIPEGIESLYDKALCSAAATDTAHKEVPQQPQDVNNDNTEALNKDSLSVGEELQNSHAYNLSFLLGLSLVLGFVVMLIIDQLSSPHTHHCGGTLEGDPSSRQRRGGVTATIGLVVHAAADGLALGVAAGLSKTDVEFIIFLAIMLHKAPAAFGFTSFLMHEGFDKQTAKCHLLIFSLAAPIAAFFSYFGLVRIMYVIKLPIMGVAMLFSAGTFLYVATVHVLNEVAHMSDSSSPSGKFSRAELIILVGGAILPLSFNLIHSH